LNGDQLFAFVQYESDVFTGSPEIEGDSSLFETRCRSGADRCGFVGCGGGVGVDGDSECVLCVGDGFAGCGECVAGVGDGAAGGGDGLESLVGVTLRVSLGHAREYATC